MTVHATRPSGIVTGLLLAAISAPWTEVSADPPSDVPEQTSVPRDVPEAKLSLSFRFAPWKEVLEWLAEPSHLSLREVTPSRLHSPQHGSERSGREDESMPREPEASTPHKQPNSQEGAGETDPKRRVLRAPVGPVRIVRVEGTDLLLIRAGGN